MHRDSPHEREAAKGHGRPRAWRARLGDAYDELYKSKTAYFGALMIAVLVAATALAPWIDGHDPLGTDLRARFEPPSREHLFGTDRYGRDVFSRVLWGGRRLLVVALAGVGLGLALGIPLGALAGFRGGFADSVAMRLTDTLLAFPGILLFLLFVIFAEAWGLGGRGRDVLLVLALGISFTPETARLARGATLGQRGLAYVDASRMVGNRGPYIALREILPNCISPLIVHATVLLGFAILAIAALSYLGLGPPPPTPDWGGDLRAAQEHMETEPLVAIFPGLAISYTVLAINMLGDGLRDVLDPRSTHG